MLLRYHPLMRYHGIPNWPPSWLLIDGVENKHPRGEVGILKSVELSQLLPANRCFLSIEHEGSLYMGCLLFDDPVFCGQVVTLLKRYCDRPIPRLGA
jgi:hypothetical protein